MRSWPGRRRATRPWRGRTERGQGLAEYALILAFIAIVAIAALAFFGVQLSGRAHGSGRRRDDRPRSWPTGVHRPRVVERSPGDRCRAARAPRGATGRLLDSGRHDLGPTAHRWATSSPSSCWAWSLFSLYGAFRTELEKSHFIGFLGGVVLGALMVSLILVILIVPERRRTAWVEAITTVNAKYLFLALIIGWALAMGLLASLNLEVNTVGVPALIGLFAGIFIFMGFIWSVIGE